MPRFDSGDEAHPTIAFDEARNSGLFHANGVCVSHNGSRVMHLGNTVTVDNTLVGNTIQATNVTTDELTVSALHGHLIPAANVTYDLGSTNQRFRDLYLSGSTIDVGGALIQSVDGNVVIQNLQVTNSISGNGSQLTGVVNKLTISNVQILDESYNVTDDMAVSLEGGNLLINGTGFAPMALCKIGSVNATSTTYISPTQMRVLVPAQPSGSYDVTIIRADSQSAILPSAVSYSDKVIWITPSLLGPVYGNVAFSLPVVATSDSNVSYSNTSALPDGVSFSSGTFEGNITASSSTLYSIDTLAVDEESQDSLRTFLLQLLIGRYITSLQINELSTFVFTNEGIYCAGDTYHTFDESSNYVTVPPAVVSGLPSITSIAAGHEHTIFLGADNTVWTCGSNYYAELGSAIINGNELTEYNNVTNITSLFNGKTVTQVAAGQNHSVFLTSDNTVYTVGRGTSGQLGDGTTVDKTSPVDITSSGDLSGKVVVGIACGANHTVFRLSDGGVCTTGLNGSGQLGDGSTIQKNVPTNISSSGALNGKSVASVVCGQNHTVFLLTDGGVCGCGSNGNGQIGDGTTTQRTLPTVITSSGGLSGNTVTGLASGPSANHTMFILSGGGVCLCGANTYGQLGDGTNIQKTVPTNVSSYGALSGKSVVDGACGQNHTIFLLSDGSACASGYNNDHELGDGAIYPNNANSNIPIASSGGALNGSSVVGVVAGRLHSMFLVSGGSVVGAGANQSGQTGSLYYWLNFKRFGHTSLDQATIVKIVGNTLFLTSDNKVYAVGSNYYGMHGDGTTAYKITPVEVTNTGLLSGNTVVDIASAGGSTSYFLLSDGRVFSAGWNYYGTVGDGTSVTRTSLINTTQYGALYGRSVVRVVSGSHSKHVFFFMSDGGICALGRNDSGQLGDGSISAPRYSAVDITSKGDLAGKTVVDIVCGAEFTMFLLSDGTVCSTGKNSSGQLGDGTTANKNLPTLIPSSAFGDKKVTSVACGSSHVAFVTEDYKVFTCGYNSYGSLADGTQTARSVPTDVSSNGSLNGRPIANVACGTDNTIFFCVDQTIHGTGAQYGTLGNGAFSFDPVLLPIEITQSLLNAA